MPCDWSGTPLPMRPHSWSNVPWQCHGMSRNRMHSCHEPLIAYGPGTWIFKYVAPISEAPTKLSTVPSSSGSEGYCWGQNEDVKTTQQQCNDDKRETAEVKAALTASWQVCEACFLHTKPLLLPSSLSNLYMFP